MAETNENLIKKIKLGGTTYDLAATQVDASAVQFGPDNQLGEGAISSVPASAITAIPASAISATDIPWESISGLSVSSTNMTSTSGLMTPAEIQKAIDAQIATVYKVKGSCKYSELPTDPQNGDVWNLTEVSEGAVDKHGAKLEVGDNVVYVDADKSGETEAGWDKLGSSIAGYATEQWTKDYVSGVEGETTEETIAKFDSLWKTTTAYVNSGITSGENGGASALWSGVETYVGDQIQSEVWDKVITAAADLSAIDSTTSGNLVNAGALSSYIDDKIESTIQETVDIASYDATKSAFINSSGTVTTSGIPDAAAVSAFADHQFIAKTDIRYGGTTGVEAYTLVIDNT